MKARSQFSSTRKKRSSTTVGKANAAEARTEARALEELRRHGRQRNVEGMAHFGIRAQHVLGVSKPKLDAMIRDFDNWDVCDGTCCHLFVFARPAWAKAFAWTRRKPEFEKRAAFAPAAYLAVHDKEAKDEPFRRFLGVIEREAGDHRNFVRKAVNWALRSIGKRNRRLNRAAIACAERIRNQGKGAARWIANDALRELKSDAVRERLKRKDR